MILQADIKDAIDVAELGAGNGVLTKHVLNQLDDRAVLDAYEIQDDLVSQLQKIALSDKKLRVFCRSAENLEKNYDVIFSCLPMLSLKKETRVSIMEQISMRLKPEGKLVLFQYSTLLEPFINEYFSWSKTYEVKNIPPAYIYTCTHKNSHID